MQRLKSKSEIKYLNKIARNSLSRKTIYFRRNLHINHKMTDVKIIRVKNKNDFFYGVKGLKELSGLECFYIHHLFSDDVNNWLLNVKDSDIIYTNTSNNKVIGINDRPKSMPDFINIWILKRNAVDYLKITIGDVVFTR